jgi:HEAT repeat protein
MDGDWRVRGTAAEALWQLGDKRAVIAALGDEYAAWLHVGLAVGDRDVGPLIAALGDKVWAVRLEAAEALGQLGDKRAVEPLIAALRDERPEVRMAAARALGQLGDKRAVEPLIAALRDEHPLVLEEAVTALGQLGDKRAVEPLIAARQEWAEDFGQNARFVEEALRSVMESCLPTIDADVLRRAEALLDIQWSYSSCSSTEWGTISFSDVRQLARQELIRRGREA